MRKEGVWKEGGKSEVRGRKNGGIRWEEEERKGEGQEGGRDEEVGMKG
jgi:hypothetical protein